MNIFLDILPKEELIKIIDNLNINPNIYIVLSLHWPGEFQNNYDTPYHNDIIKELVESTFIVWSS